MAYYSVTYDLIKSKDYNKMYEGIKAVSNDIWARPTRSQWIIVTNKTAAQVRDFLQSYMDADDVLFVIEVDKSSWASWNVDKKITDWLNS